MVCFCRSLAEEALQIWWQGTFCFFQVPKLILVWSFLGSSQGLMQYHPATPCLRCRHIKRWTSVLDMKQRSFCLQGPKTYEHQECKQTCMEHTVCLHKYSNNVNMPDALCFCCCCCCSNIFTKFIESLFKQDSNCFEYE